MMCYFIVVSLYNLIGRLNSSHFCQVNREGTELASDMIPAPWGKKTKFWLIWKKSFIMILCEKNFIQVQSEFPVQSVYYKHFFS